MFKKICNICIYLIILIAIVMIIIGIIKLVNVNNSLQTGIEEVEDVFGGDDNTNTFSAVENEKSREDGKAIGILTFKLAKQYKTAVYNNITEQILQKGVGRATGSSNLNETGNCVLFGHRDSAFRALWDIKIGDKVEAKTKDSLKEYEVKNIYITTPYDPKIFEETQDTKLTLVTCYPFVYSGPADKRCIVECF